MKHRLVLALISVILLTVAFVPVAAAESQGVLFTVIGLVYEDQNLDGAYSMNLSGVEPGIVNVTMSLYLDHEPLGVLGAEDKLLETQITNTEGYVVFRNVMSGFYFLRPNMMTNFVPTTPTTQALTLKGDVQGAALEWTFGLAPRAQMPARIFLPAISR